MKRTADFDKAQNDRLRAKMREWLAANGGKKVDLAKRLRISGASLSRILNRKGGVSYATACELADMFGVKVEELIGPRSSQSEQPSDEFPNRARAVELARQAGVHEPAISWALAVKVKKDQPVPWWLARIMARHDLEVTAPAPSHDLTIQRALNEAAKDVEEMPDVDFDEGEATQR